MTAIPLLPRALGLAGLLPQLACLLALWFGPDEWRGPAQAIGLFYAALILSFLGGLWWGIAAAQVRFGRRVPAWLWIASILPSLVALAALLPLALGFGWPGPSLVAVGIALIVALRVDHRIAPSCPTWWMNLRVPLSLGLGVATLAIAAA